MKSIEQLATAGLVVLFVLSISGCVALAPLAVGAGAGVMGVGVYNAANEDKQKPNVAGNPQGPHFLTYKCREKDAVNAIVEVLVESGDSVAAATDRLVKTEKRRISEEAGAISSLLGKNEVYAIKTITLTPEGANTKILMKVDLYSKTVMTTESKKDWPDQEGAIRSQFFDALSKKLKPAT